MVFDSWLVSRTRHTYVLLEVLHCEPPRLAPFPPSLAMDANGRNCTPSTSTGHPKQIPTIFSFSNRDMQGRGGLGTMNEHCTPIHSYFKEMDDHVLAKKGKVRSNSSLRTTRNDTRLMTTAHEQPHYGETLDVPYKIFWCWWLWKITRTFSQNNPSQLNKALRSIRKEHLECLRHSVKLSNHLS